MEAMSGKGGFMEGCEAFHFGDVSWVGLEGIDKFLDQGILLLGCFPQRRQEADIFQATGT
jgi:hypothetical protein